MNNALATRTHVAHAGHVAPQAPAMLAGVHLVPAGPCQLHGVIDAGDVLRVDFDCRVVKADGLYLVEAVSADGVEWMGCRRFAVTVAGVQVEDGGAWCDVPSGLRVAGRVAQVYRAVH